LDILASFFFSVALRALGLARVSSSVSVVSASSYTLPFEIRAHNRDFLFRQRQFFSLVFFFFCSAALRLRALLCD
jgi:hypothetical protein